VPAARLARPRHCPAATRVGVALWQRRRASAASRRRGTSLAALASVKEIPLVREGQHRRTFAFVLEPGEDPIVALTDRANAYALASCQITAIGGFARATLGYFERAQRVYRKIPIDQQVEVLSLLGDIAHADTGRIVHVHCVLGLPDGTTRGGHLLDAQVWPTLEVILTEWPKFLQKRFDASIGLALIDRARS
jgi:predicted DNA-binding protein with PD1-like motif